MPYTTQTRLGPEFTPKIIKNLILITVIASITSILLEPLFNLVFGIAGPMTLLTLSLRGITNYYLWQPFTYLFVVESGGLRVNLFWLIGVAVNMYILWVMGSNILERVGAKPFLRLYFISGVLSGLVALLFMYLTGYNTIIGGPTAPILAILTCWAILNPESQLLLFFVIPIKSRWLVVGILGVMLFLALASLDFVHFFFYASAAATGYFYSVFGWGHRSPFPFTQNFDHALERLIGKIKHFTQLKRSSPGKIFDIKTGKSVDDDERFMDAMLEKISKHGRESLTRREKNRMDKISKRKHR